MGQYTAELQKLYVAYFSRPADPVGLSYWEAVITNAVAAGSDQESVLTAIGRSFAASPEYTQQYGNKTSVEIVNAIYANLFGRSAETEGLTYWATKIENGSLTVNDVVRVIYSNAAASDAVAFANKVTVANNFTNAIDTTAEVISYSGSSAGQLAKLLLTSVTSDATTVQTADAKVNAVLNDLVSFDVIRSAAVTQTLNNFTLGTATTTGTVLDLGSGVRFLTSVSSTAVPGFTAEALSYAVSSSGVISFSGVLSKGLSAGQEGTLINTILGNQFNTAVLFKTTDGGITNSYVYANLAGADKFVSLPNVDAAGGSSSGVAGAVNVVQIGQPPVTHDSWSM